MNRLTTLATALLAVVTLAACGAKKDVTAPPGSQRVRLLLDYLPNADHAGIYTAIADGAFRRAGLDVKPEVPSDPSAPLKLLQAGKADIAISYEPELLLARDKGLPLVAIGALVQRPLTSIISLPKGRVKEVADLEGKTVGTAGIPYQSAYLKTILRDAGADPARVKEVDVGFNLVPAMLSGRVDATLGGFSNVEGVQLRRDHKRPTVIPVDKAGVPTYDELVLVARAQDLRDRGPFFRAFLQALARGHADLRKSPARGVDALLKANPDLKRPLQEASLKATVSAFFPADRRRPFGSMDPTAWARYGKWMFDNKLVKRQPAGRSLTNEFLPGEGL